jgi:hypothetical protein
MKYGFLSTKILLIQRLHHTATSTTPQPMQTCPSANPEAIGDYLFFVLPQNKGGRGGVGARSSSSKNPQLPQQQQQRAPGETR